VASSRPAESTTAKQLIVSVLAAILAIYVAAAFLVDPRGEFPLNDDWCYTRSAFLLGTGQGMHLDEWAAPSLVGQALYGAALVAGFGTSFTALRISTIVLSCAVACLLVVILREAGMQNRLAWFAALSWIFNPVQFCLAFTFMTEVPFIFFLGLGTYLYARHLRRRSLPVLLLSSAAFGYAFLIRQTAALFIGPLLCAVLLGRPKDSWHTRLSAFFAAGLPASLLVGGYYAWLAGRGGLTPATQRKFDLLEHITTEQIAGNAYGILFYLSFMLLPLLPVAVPQLWRALQELRRGTRIALVAAWAIVSASGLWWFYMNYSSPGYLPSEAFHSRMPFLLNVLYDTGLGPVTLDPTYYGTPVTPTYPQAWRVVTGLVAAATVPLGVVISLAFARSRSFRRRAPARGQFLLFAVLSFLAVAVFEIIFSHLQEGGLFDRHLLTAVFPMILMFAVIPAESVEHRGFRLAGYIVGVALAACAAWFCISATHDYLAWNRIRWDMGRQLLARGVDPLTASCGFEFNAWHNYDAFRARGNIGKIYYWWYDRKDYLIAMAPQEGYRIVQQEEYCSWVHRQSVPLYLLQK
jgi:4-amino-4-deoxy-L-arabinose transferase-like glycosyltransferase